MFALLVAMADRHWPVVAVALLLVVVALGVAGCFDDCEDVAQHGFVSK